MVRFSIIKWSIFHLTNTKEGLRFICVRKYVEQLENIVLKVYEIIQEYKQHIELDDKQRATVIFLGDKDNSKQEIVKSTYWSNLYGKDGNKDDIDNLIGNMNKEELEILNTAFKFIEELKKEKISVEILDSLIYSATKKDWGDYIEAQKSYKSLEKPGLSTVVRYNDNHTMAYVRIFTHVDDVFIIYDTHVIEELYEISFVKENHKWKIFSMGGHLDSYIIE